MCSVCGALSGAEHWAAGAGRIASAPTRRAERQAQVRVARALLAARGMRVDDWQGSAFLVSGPTGAAELAADLSQVWAAAQRLLGRPIDPLDAALLERLDRAAAR